MARPSASGGKRPKISDNSEGSVTSRVARATFDLDERHLPDLALLAEDLPEPYLGYRLRREGELNNRQMAERGFPEASEERFAAIGRVSGFMREFGPPPPALASDGVDFAVGSVAHIFGSPENVGAWMREVFLGDFFANAGADVGGGQTLARVERLEPQGFYDEAVGLKTLHYGSGHTISSTIIDFRVGRILGVAFVATVGDYPRLNETTRLGIAMEQLIVAVSLGA